MELSGVAFGTRNDCKQGLPWIKELWMSKLLHLCLHAYALAVFSCLSAWEVYGFFSNAGAALHWAAKISCWKLCPELCLQLNPHLPAQSFGPAEWRLHAWTVQGGPQTGCWGRKVVPPRGNGSTADSTPGVTSCWLWWGPQLHPAWLCQGTGASRDSSRAAADRAALSSGSSCPVEPGSVWSLRGHQDLLANM